MPLRDYKKIFFDVFKLYKWSYIPFKILNYPIYSKKVWFDPLGKCLVQSREQIVARRCLEQSVPTQWFHSLAYI